MKFSVVIPALNEEKNIAACLASVVEQQHFYKKYPFETIIVDGGSTDKTLEIAKELVLKNGCNTIFQKNFKIIKPGFPNLALQLNEGAHYSKGETLVFLHADTILPGKAFEKISGLFSAGFLKKFILKKGKEFKNKDYVGGAFTLLVKGNRFYYRISSLFGNLYSLITRIYFGDRVIFIKKSAFNELGGFKNIPIMSDVDFSIRMKTIGKTALIPGPAITTPRGIEGDPFWKRTYLILWALHSFKKGLEPAIIKERYYRSYSRKK